MFHVPLNRRKLDESRIPKTYQVSAAACCSWRRGRISYDASGKQYLDGSGGAAVSCLGHSDPDVIAAIKAQIDDMAFAHTGFFTSDAAESLADRLIAHAPG